MNFGNGGSKKNNTSYYESFSKTVNDVLNSNLGKKIVAEAFRRGLNYRDGRNNPRLNYGVDVD